MGRVEISHPPSGSATYLDPFELVDGPREDLAELPAVGDETRQPFKAGVGLLRTP